MIRLIQQLLFLPFILAWIYPVALFEILRLSKYGYSNYSLLLLFLGPLFSYLMLNLRRDRLDVSKHYELLSFIKKYENSVQFTLMDRSDYISDTKLTEFINSYQKGRGIISGLAKGKVKKFVQNRVRIVLLEPKKIKGKKLLVNLPSGYKTFPSYITHQTTIFTINKPNKLNPLLRFFINHELGHMHRYALSDISMREIGTFPFLWGIFWAFFTVDINLVSIVIFIIILIIVLISEIKNEDVKMNTTERTYAEIASDFVGLKLLDEKDLQHQIFDKIKFKDHSLNNQEDKLRNDSFKKMLEKLRNNENFDLPRNFHFRKRIFVLTILFSMLFFHIEEPNEVLIKFTIGLCVFVQFQRFIHHREINRILVNIKDRTNVDLSRFRTWNETRS